VPVPVNFGRGGPGQPRPTFTVLSVPPFQMEGGLVIPVNSGLGRPGRRRSEILRYRHRFGSPKVSWKQQLLMRNLKSTGCMLRAQRFCCPHTA
jgi:hypothetical protein